MAYNGRFISIQPVVETVFRDGGFGSVDWESAVEWTAQLIGKLGLPQQYITITTNGMGDNPIPLPVEEYRTKLPIGMRSIKSCRRVKLDDNGEIMDFSPMIESADIYHNTQFENESYPTNSFDPTVNVVDMSLDSEGDLDYEINPVNQDRLENNPRLPNKYKIQGDYIFTDFKEGNIEMVYESYPIDFSGFPMVPDDPKYLAALEHYIIYKLDWKAWRRHPASPGLRALLNDSEQQSLWYIGAARSKAHIPSVDGMESLKNMWLRSIPKPNEHANGFKSLNAPEVRYNNFPSKRRY